MVNTYQNPTFGYAFQFATELHYCEVVMAENAYLVKLKWQVAELQLNDNMEWMLAAGVPLAQSTISEIGRKIESVFM